MLSNITEFGVTSKLLKLIAFPNVNNYCNAQVWPGISVTTQDLQLTVAFDLKESHVIWKEILTSDTSKELQSIVSRSPADVVIHRDSKSAMPEKCVTLDLSMSGTSLFRSTYMNAIAQDLLFSLEQSALTLERKRAVGQTQKWTGNTADFNLHLGRDWFFDWMCTCSCLHAPYRDSENGLLSWTTNLERLAL